MRQLPDFTFNEKYYSICFMFTFPNKGDTLDLFSLSVLSFFMVFLVWFALTMYSPQSHKHVCFALWNRVSPIYLSFCVGVKKMANECSQTTCYPIITFLKNPKKDAKMLWMYDWKCHLQDCTFLTVLFTKGIQLNWRKKKEKDLLYCL